MFSRRNTDFDDNNAAETAGNGPDKKFVRRYHDISRTAQSDHCPMPMPGLALGLAFRQAR